MFFTSHSCSYIQKGYLYVFCVYGRIAKYDVTPSSIIPNTFSRMWECLFCSIKNTFLILSLTVLGKWTSTRKISRRTTRRKSVNVQHSIASGFNRNHLRQQIVWKISRNRQRSSLWISSDQKVWREKKKRLASVLASSSYFSVLKYFWVI